MYCYCFCEFVVHLKTTARQFKRRKIRECGRARLVTMIHYCCCDWMSDLTHWRLPFKGIRLNSRGLQRRNLDKIQLCCTLKQIICYSTQIKSEICHCQQLLFLRKLSGGAVGLRSPAGRVTVQIRTPACVTSFTCDRHSMRNTWEKLYFCRR